MNGQIRKLLKVKSSTQKEDLQTTTKHLVKKQKSIIKDDDNYKFPAKEVNTLARKRFQEQLLKDIRVDLMVCELEGWNKTEYIKELHSLLDDIVGKLHDKGE